LFVRVLVLSSTTQVIALQLPHSTKRGIHKQLLKQIKNARLSGFINPINFAARISELVSAGTNHNGALMEKVPQVVSLGSDIIKGPFYRLNMKRVKQVIRRSGVLT